MIAIITKRTPSGRIVATAGDRRIIVDPAGVSGDEAHKRAARALCRRYSWGGVLAMGDIDHHSRAFVWVPRSAAGIETAFLFNLIVVDKE